MFSNTFLIAGLNSSQSSLIPAGTQRPAYIGQSLYARPASFPATKAPLTIVTPRRALPAAASERKRLSAAGTLGTAPRDAAFSSAATAPADDSDMTLSAVQVRRP